MALSLTRNLHRYAMWPKAAIQLADLWGNAHEVAEECGPVLGRDDGRDALFHRDLDGLSRESSLVYEAFPATGSCTPSVLAES
ncbi:hypothetical protein TVH25_19435, partial [Rhodococcus sp. 7Tela_A2]